MTDGERMLEIRRRLEADTEGTWHTDGIVEKLRRKGHGVGIWASLDSPDSGNPIDVVVAEWGESGDGDFGSGVMRNEDAEFIANAKSDIRFLLDLLDRRMGGSSSG